MPRQEEMMKIRSASLCGVREFYNRPRKGEETFKASVLFLNQFCPVYFLEYATWGQGGLDCD